MTTDQAPQNDPTKSCPACGSLALMLPMGGVVTAMAYQRYTDDEGRLHSHDPNWGTDEYACRNCKAVWNVSTRTRCPQGDYGGEVKLGVPISEVREFVDDGKRPGSAE